MPPAARRPRPPRTPARHLPLAAGAVDSRSRWRCTPARVKEESRPAPAAAAAEEARAAWGASIAPPEP